MPTSRRPCVLRMIATLSWLRPGRMSPRTSFERMLSSSWSLSSSSETSKLMSPPFYQGPMGKERTTHSCSELTHLSLKRTHSCSDLIGGAMTLRIGKLHLPSRGKPNLSMKHVVEKLPFPEGSILRWRALEFSFNLLIACCEEELSFSIIINSCYTAQVQQYESYRSAFNYRRAISTL